MPGEDIALLFGIAIARQEFLSSIARSDYLARFDDPRLPAPERRALHDRVWSRVYAPFVGQPCLALAQRAARLGVCVKRGATLRTLTQACREHSVIVLLGHWKGPEFANDDFLPGLCAGEVCRRIATASSPMADWLARELDGDPALQKPGARRPAHALRRRLATWARRLRQRWRGPRDIRQLLREALQANTDRPLDGVIVRELPLTRATRNREALDTLLDGLVRPGNRLELCDGLHDRCAIDAAVPGDFRGVVDLTTCTSTPLADFIAARREWRMRTVQFPTEQEPGWAVQCLHATLDLVARGWPYLDARARAYELVGAAVRGLPDTPAPERPQRSAQSCRR